MDCERLDSSVDIGFFTSIRDNPGSHQGNILRQLIAANRMRRIWPAAMENEALTADTQNVDNSITRRKRVIWSSTQSRVLICLVARCHIAPDSTIWTPPRAGSVRVLKPNFVFFGEPYLNGGDEIDVGSACRCFSFDRDSAK